jgi:hypothetical protein
VNLTALLADLYGDLRYTATPPAATTARLTRYLNRTQRELLTLPGLSRLRDLTVAITTVSNQPQSSLPLAVARIQTIVDRANNHVLDQVPLRELRDTDPAQNFIGGPPLRYAVVGERHVAQQPAAACELFVDFTGGTFADLTVNVEGIRSDGSLVAITKVCVVGTPTQSLATTETAIVAVTKYYLAPFTVNPSVPVPVILRSVSGAGTELARIPVGQTYARYLTVEWSPTPTTAVPLFVDCTRQVLDLILAGDEPLVPPDFHYVVALGARVKEYEFISDTRIAGARLDYDTGKRALRSWVLNDGDRVVSLRSVNRGWSQLGGQYPAGS